MHESMKEDSERCHPHGLEERSRLKRLLWATAGTIALALGFIGIAVPVMPTTPFLLLAAACYLRGSRRMYDWLMGNRWFGTYLLDYMEGRGIPMMTKVLALVVLWSTIGLSMIFVTTNSILRVILLVVAVGVTIHLAMVKTRRDYSKKG
jgi:uncharacterized membrane protein YbaN (DUF454 family)